MYVAGQGTAYVDVHYTQRRGQVPIVSTCDQAPSKIYALKRTLESEKRREVQERDSANTLMSRLGIDTGDHTRRDEIDMSRLEVHVIPALPKE